MITSQINAGMQVPFAIFYLLFIELIIIQGNSNPAIVYGLIATKLIEIILEL
jgi:hypothetical protein